MVGAKIMAFRETDPIRGKICIMTQYWNKLILLIIWDIIYPLKEKKI
jgi:hypothetical protein